MEIISPAFDHNGLIPVQYTCAGANINPPLQFRDIPPSALSLVLIVEDMDAPANPWVHWLVFNIPPTTKLCFENTFPEGGIEGFANGGTPGYEGPCGKYFHGTHHYHFRLYALDRVLDLPPAADRRAVLEAMNGAILAQAELIGLAEGEGSAL